MKLPFAKSNSNVITLPNPLKSCSLNNNESSHSRDESLFTHTKQSSDSSSSYPSPPTEVKAKRKRANPYQLDRLQRAYDLNPFPSNEERQYLANELGMSPNSVRIWYQNKRQALRNFEKAQSQSP